jgi:hypothetical protein
MKLLYKMSFIFLLFVLNFNLIYSAESNEISYCNINMYSDAIPLIIIGLIISILFVSLFYMYGKFMSNSEVEGTYMVELQQIGLTMVMIIFITGGLGILCSVSLNEGGLFISSEQNVYSSVRNNQLLMMEKTILFYTNLMDVVNYYGILGSAQAGVAAKGFNIGFSPVSSGNFVSQTIAPLGQMVLIAYFAQAFQYALFEFTRSKIFLLLLPVGLVLRSFPITRKFGGVLIALVLGLSYLYPLFLNFGYIFVDFDSVKMIKNEKSAVATLFGISAATVALSFVFSNFPEPATQFIQKYMALFLLEGFSEASSVGGFSEMGGGGNALGIVSTLTGTNERNFDMFEGMYSSFGTIILGTFFIPALLIIILGAVVRSLSASIGTETDITGILRAV